jgi:hypothetical protein
MIDRRTQRTRVNIERLRRLYEPYSRDERHILISVAIGVLLRAYEQVPFAQMRYSLAECGVPSGVQWSAGGREVLRELS